MSSLENTIQGIVHNIEQGGGARWIKLIALLVGVIALSLLYVLLEFKGLSEPAAMEQAQAAREIARGNGFSTHSIRPLAVWQMSKNNKEIPQVAFPDTYHGPVNPYINSMPLLAVKKWWTLSKDALVSVPDRVIACVQIAFFFLSLIVLYFTAIRLFDRRLALLGTGLLVVYDIFWQFSLSGLPQMVMLFFFSLAMYCLVRAIEGTAEQKRVGFWLSGIGVLFGVLALTHALTIWLFAGLLVFVFCYFKPRILSVILVLGFFLVVYSPWLIRNQMVTGTVTGVSVYAALDGVKQSERGWMRQTEPDFKDVSARSFRRKLVESFSDQVGRLYQLLGAGIAVPAFFISLLHPFRKREAFMLRWALLCMWIPAIIGMTIFGLGPSPTSANSLHVLFVPLMTFYGVAFLIVLWTRLPIDYAFMRVSFLVLIYVITAVPALVTLIPERASRINWPPYVPPYIAILGKWTQPQEILSSDMGWAVGWYADRRCLWLPATVNEFIQYNDYEKLGGPIVGLYFTPITGNAKFMADIFKGEYKEWATFILRSPNLKDFPLKAGIPLPLDNECLFISDRDRWSGEQIEQ